MWIAMEFPILHRIALVQFTPDCLPRYPHLHRERDLTRKVHKILTQYLCFGYQDFVLYSLTWRIRFWMVDSRVGSLFIRSSIFWHPCMTVV